MFLVSVVRIDRSLIVFIIGGFRIGLRAIALVFVEVLVELVFTLIHLFLDILPVFKLRFIL